MSVDVKHDTTARDTGIAMAPEAHPRPRRSWGFWLISPWRHMMVSLWAFPMFMVVCQGRPGMLLLCWLLAIAIDIIAACRAPDSRLKHADIVGLLAQGRELCCVTTKDIWVRLGVLSSITVFNLYTLYLCHTKQLAPQTGNLRIAIAIAAALAFISLSGVRMRNIAQLPINQKPFLLNKNFMMAKRFWLVLFGWPGPFYIVTSLSTRVLFWATSEWTGSTIALIGTGILVYADFLFCVALTPAAYAVSKVKPYIK